MIKESDCRHNNFICVAIFIKEVFKLSELHQEANIEASFSENGYYLAPGVFSGKLLDEMQVEFDRIVDQLRSSGEDINARWQGSV